MGIWFHDKWFQLQWQGLEGARQQNITVNELLPIVIGAAIWGPLWKGKSVRAECDNAAVVAILRSRSSSEPEAMHLLRCLAFLEAQHSFWVFASHIQGVLNGPADRPHCSISLPLSAGSAVPSGNSSRGAGRPGGVKIRLDIPVLDATVEQLFKQGLAESTQQSYVKTPRDQLAKISLVLARKS